MRPTYTGIAGATNHPTTYDASDGFFTGKVSLGGVLIPWDTVKLSDIPDGTSHTIVVGEQSAWLDSVPDTSGGHLVKSSQAAGDRRSDQNHGFMIGPFARSWTSRQFNLTHVHHRINERSGTAYAVIGDGTPNTPIHSAHSGGAQALFADGSIHFLNEALDIDILFNLANRDDGASIPASAL